MAEPKMVPEINWDKPAPTGPPTPQSRDIPAHLVKIVRFFESIAADEGVLLDICMDRAVDIVEFNFKKRLAGSDFFAEQQPTAATFTMIASPLAVELYKQCLQSVKDRQDEYVQLLKEAHEASKSKRGPVIVQA